MARILTSKIETSGQRFLHRRIDQAVTQRDSRMFHAPMNVQAVSASVGLVFSALAISIGLFLNWLKPQTTLEKNKIGQIGGTIYILAGGKLHEVYNMASARLIQGDAAEPQTLKPEELSAYPRGGPMGILDAPTVLAQAKSKDSHFTVCFTKSVKDSVVTSPLGTSVIIGPLDNPQRLTGNDAVLVRDPAPARPHALNPLDRYSKVWMLYQGNRSLLNIRDKALTSALGVNGSILNSITQVSPGFFNSVPQTDPLILPRIFHKNQPASYAPRYKIGQIGKVTSATGTRFYLVLEKGLAKITPLVEAIMENRETNNPLVNMTSHDATTLPQSEYATPQFPEKPPTFKMFNTMCESWDHTHKSPTATKSLYAQDALPISSRKQSQMIHYGVLKSHKYATADSAYVEPGYGWFVRAVDNEAGPISREESVFYISDTGICYGIPSYIKGGAGGESGQMSKDSAALGFDGEPVEAPAQIISLFPQGSVLSKENALAIHGYIPVDHNQVEGTK